MPSSTVPDFLDVLEKSGLLTAQQLTERFGSELPTDPARLADALVRTQLLTAYQAKQLLLGKHRGFFLGPYKVLRPIGKGGMGVVYLGEHTSLDRKVALKVLPADKSKDQITLDRFQREARAAAALDHPNIVRLYDISRGAGIHFLVMEYVDGNDLQSLLAQTGPLHYAQAAQYVAQVAAGLQHAHDKGFIHRDLKPANLMLAKDGTVKVLDMGLARRLHSDEDNLTAVQAEGEIVGTVDYLSPEQAMNQPLDARSDIYGLGATFYTLAAGHPPFSGSTAQKLAQHQLREPPDAYRKLNGRVPPALSAVITRMMAKNPADRYQTAAEVIDALGPWLAVPSTGSVLPVADTQTTSGGSGALRAGGRGSKRKGLFAAIGGVAALVGVGLAWLGRAPAPQPTGTEPPAVVSAPTPSTDPEPKPIPKPPELPVVYRWDLSKLSLVRQERPVEETHSRVKAGLLPQGWSFFRSTDSTCSPFCEVVPEGDGKAVLFGKVFGDGIVRLSGGFTPPLDKGRTYKLRVQYSAENGFTGDLAVRRGFAELDTPLVAEVPATNGRWQWVEYEFATDPEKKAELLIFTNSSPTPIGIKIRAVEVLDVTNVPKPTAP
jgi:serine/threonine protein kinase